MEASLGRRQPSVSTSKVQTRISQVSQFNPCKYYDIYGNPQVCALATAETVWLLQFWPDQFFSQGEKIKVHFLQKASNIEEC